MTDDHDEADDWLRAIVGYEALEQDFVALVNSYIDDRVWPFAREELIAKDYSPGDLLRSMARVLKAGAARLDELAQQFPT